MLLSEYLLIRNGVDSNGITRKVLSSGEAKMFGVNIAKSGWANKDIDIPIELIGKAISYIQKRDNIKPQIKSRLLDFSVKTCNKLEKKLYLFKNELGLHKIGISVTPAKRARVLLNASGYKIFIVGVWEVPDAATQEKHLHRVFKKSRVEGEWFKIELTTEDIEANLTCDFKRIEILN